MATAEQVKIEVLARLSTLGRPMFDAYTNTDDFNRYCDNYVEALKAFDTHTLRRGISEIVQVWTRTDWPPPGKIREVCLRIEGEDREKYRPPAIPVLPPEQPIERDERLAIAARWERLRKLWMTPEYQAMSHSEAYDRVYGKELWPGHKAKIMERLSGYVMDH